MYKADKLYNDMMDIDASIKDLEVKDEASIANYFELYTHLIFTLKLTSAFPDMTVTMRDTFAVKYEDGYKLWRYFIMSGTNKTYSVYGPASNKPLNSDACIVMSMATVKQISGRWQIVKEFVMYSIDEIRATCLNTEVDACDSAAKEEEV